MRKAPPPIGETAGKEEMEHGLGNVCTSLSLSNNHKKIKFYV